MSIKKIISHFGYQNGFDMLLVTNGTIGYLVCTFFGKIDPKQCLCCWEEELDHCENIINSVREAEGLKKIIFCGSGYEIVEKKFRIQAWLNNLLEENLREGEIEEIKKYLKSVELN